METQAYTFELKNDLTELRSLEQHLFNLAGLANLSDKSILRINVCLDELFTNIVSYGFEDDLEHVIKFARHACFRGIGEATRGHEESR